MKKLILTGLVAAVMFTGCVKQAVHDQAMSALATREMTIEDLNRELEDLTAQKKKEAADYESRIDDLASQGITTTREMQEIGLERDRYAEISRIYDDRNAELEGENAYLSRENERLQIKAGELSAQKEQELASVKSTYNKLMKEMEQEINKGEIKITQAVDRLSVSMVEQILFDSGKTEIKPNGLEILKRVGEILNKVEGKQIRVEGHTDDVPIGIKLRKTYPTNWELSTARATNVVRYIQGNAGVAPERLSAAGMSQYHPVASNETREGKAQNRRIEIILLPSDVSKVLEELKQ